MGAKMMEKGQEDMNDVDQSKKDIFALQCSFGINECLTTSEQSGAREALS